MNRRRIWLWWLGLSSAIALATWFGTDNFSLGCEAGAAGTDTVDCTVVDGRAWDERRVEIVGVTGADVVTGRSRDTFSTGGTTSRLRLRAAGRTTEVGPSVRDDSWDPVARSINRLAAGASSDQVSATRDGASTWLLVVLPAAGAAMAAVRSRRLGRQAAARSAPSARPPVPAPGPVPGAVRSGDVDAGSGAAAPVGLIRVPDGFLASGYSRAVEAGATHDEILDAARRLDPGRRVVDMTFYAATRRAGLDHASSLVLLAVDGAAWSYTWLLEHGVSFDEVCDAARARIDPQTYRRARAAAPHADIIEAAAAGAYVGDYARYRAAGLPHAEMVAGVRGGVTSSHYALVRMAPGTDRDLLGITHGEVMEAHAAGVYLATYRNARMAGLTHREILEADALGVDPANYRHARRTLGLTHDEVVARPALYAYRPASAPQLWLVERGELRLR